MTILATGGSGKIGSEVVRSLPVGAGVDAASLRSEPLGRPGRMEAALPREAAAQRQAMPSST